MQHKEFELQKAICKYITLQYPDVVFLSDTVASVKLTMGQALRNKAIQKSGFKIPDLIILCPNKFFHGLMFELKTESPFKKDGTIKSNEHLQGQYQSLQVLKSLGYWADFVWDFSTAKGVIDHYLKDR